MPADLEAIERLEHQAFPRAAPRAPLAGELAAEHARLVIARIGDIVGYCNYWLVIDELQLHTVAADPAFRRAGIGYALVAYALEDGRAHGCRSATLEVRAGNVAALALYQRHGFRTVHVRAGYYQDPSEDALIMTADLLARS